MKHLRIFETAELAAAILPTLEYSTLSKIRGESGVSLNLGVVPPAPAVDITTPFFVENISDEDGVITIWQDNTYGQAYTLPIQKSTDASNWETAGSTSTTNLTIPIQAHSKVYLRCDTHAWSYFDVDEREDAYNCIKCNKSHNVGGNIFSLLYGSSFTNQTAYRDGSIRADSEFGRLFYNDGDLIDAGDLILPTSVRSYSFMEMFKGCSKLCRVKCLVKSLPSNFATSNWLSGVSSTGTFIKSPEMSSWPSGANGIPSGWTVQDAV